MQQQVISAIDLAPVAPLWLVAALAVLCAAAVGFALWRRASGAVWRGLAFAVLLGWLCGPRAIRETRLPLSDIAVVVFDQTASMRMGDRTKLVEAARAALEADGRRIAGLELRIVVVPDSAHDGTRLFTALDRTLATIPADRLAGVVAITDGQVHDVPAAWAHGVPLHVLLAGHAGEIDRRVRLLRAPEFGVVGKSVTVQAIVEDLGVQRPDQPATLTIRRDGEPPRVESVPVGEPHDIDIPINREGPSAIELTVNTLPGEVSAANNRVVAQINGVRDRLRVLLVSGEPHAGERTWRRLLKADPAVDLVHFTILRPPDKDDATPLNELALIAFPTRELFQQKIGEFDLIILDRFQNRGILALPYVRNIADYVRRGGALLVSVGPEFAGPLSLDESPLQGVLPAHPLRDADGQTNADAVIEGAFRPAVTPLGRRHPVTASLPGLPAATGAGAVAGGDWGPWYRYIAADGVHGQVLMSAGGGATAPSPLLVLDRVEKGRVALLLSDQIWLWSRGHEGGGPQAELLRRVTHWLLRQPALDEESLTARVAAEPGRTAVTWTRASTGDGPPPRLAVTAPDGTRTDVALEASGPGQSTATMAAPEAGVWQASDGAHTAFAAVGVGDATEFADLRASADVVGALARGSGGGIHWFAAADGGGAAMIPVLRRVGVGQAASGRDWIGLPRRDAHIVTGVAATPLLPGWLALLLILGLAVTAWWREAA